MSKQLIRLGVLLSLALLVVSCQRRVVYLSTPPGTSLGATATPERSASLQQVAGQVEARPSATGEWSPARVGQGVAEGSQVRVTESGQAVIRLTEGSRIYLGPGTEVTLNQLNPYLDSLLTTITLERGRVWVLLNGGALDVQTPYGTALARAAYLSVDLEPQTRQLNVMCLQGVCGFGAVAIPATYKLMDAKDNTAPEPMQMGDYGAWAMAVPEATELAYLATESVAQGSATLPPGATATLGPTAQPIPSSTPTPPLPTDTRPAPPTRTNTPPAKVPTETAVPTTTQPPPVATATSTSPAPPTPVPSPTLPPQLPSVTPVPVTRIPPAPILGTHLVLPGETIFCIGRGYGVLPAAIAQANGLPVPFNIRAGQTLRIPEVQWGTILPGPVCPPQFPSPFPALPVPTATLEASPTPAGPPLGLVLDYLCVANCGSRDGSYVVRVNAAATGGVPPYTFSPAQSFDVTVPHCTNGSGSVSATSADGQTASATWSYVDVACPGGP